MAGMRAALPDLRDEDVIGSPYCVRDYVVDPRFGSLAAAREALAARGPEADPRLRAQPRRARPPVARSGPAASSTAPRTTSRAIPRRGCASATDRRPRPRPVLPGVAGRRAAQRVLARAARGGRRAAARGWPACATALRCDMAMLMTNEVFSRTWGLDAARRRSSGRTVLRDDLVFIAEAYWDMEYALQQQGFDYCYDKRLYDRLAHEDAAAVRGHLRADLGYQQRLLRFIENHDEPRAATDVRPARAGGGGRDVDGSGRPALPRRPVRGTTARTSRSSWPAGRTSRPTTTCGRSTRAAALGGRRHGLAARGRRRLAGQRLVPEPRGLVVRPAHLVVVNLSDAPAQGAA